MAVTETTSQSWFSRIGDAFKGIIVGLALVVAAVVLLWWNEGRTIKTYKSLKEGAAAVVSGDSQKVDAELEGKLVHMTGEAVTEDVLSDDELKVSVPAMKLTRTVEIYQWIEDSKSESKKKIGGSEETVTTYTYRKGWTDHLIDSSGFKEAGHDNPTMVPYESADLQATNAQFGAFHLNEGQISRINKEQPLKVDRIDPSLAAMVPVNPAAQAPVAPVAPAAPATPAAQPAAPAAPATPAAPAAPAEAAPAPVAPVEAVPAEAAPAASQSTSTQTPDAPAAEAPVATEAATPATEAAPAPAEAAPAATAPAEAAPAAPADANAAAPADAAQPADAPEEEPLTSVILKSGKKLQVFQNGFYLGNDPAMPEIGDLKISYEYVAPKQEISVVSQQSGDTFVPWQAKAGNKVDLLSLGKHSAEEMFESAQKANTTMAWLLRIGGFFLMFMGLNMVLKPLQVIADVLPFLGSIIGAGAGIVAFLLAGVGATITIGIAWLYYRPVLAVSLFVVAAVLLIMMGQMKKKKA